MTDSKTIDVLVKSNNGILRISEALRLGVSKETLSRYIRDNGYERASKGVYLSPNAWWDEFLLLQLRCPRTVFSHETALYLHDMTDREPLALTVTAPTGYNPSHLTSAGIKAYTVKKELFDVGLTHTRTPYGNVVFAYNPERTICDLLRARRHIDPQIYRDALRSYVGDKSRNLPLLMSYADMFHVQRPLREQLGVLL